MTDTPSLPFRLEGGARAPRILARIMDTDVTVAEFPATGTLRPDALRPVVASTCLAALNTAFQRDGHDESGPAVPLDLLALALIACDEADVAFAVVNIGDGLTPQARRAAGEAWVLIQEAIGARRGSDCVYAQVARENRAVLRARVAADAIDRYADAVQSGQDPDAARGEALAAAADPTTKHDDPADTVWNLARELVAAWPEFDGDEPVSGADTVAWLTEMRSRFRRALLPRQC